MLFSGDSKVPYRLLSIPVSLVAAALAHFLKTPNPMMILIIPVVFFCYADGYIGGLLSGLVAVAYSLYFFSNPGALFTYNQLNVEKVLTIVAAVSVIVILVGRLQARVAGSIRKHEDHIREMLKINGELDRAVIAAQKASLAKSRFLSNVSHDIRTPMNVIIGMTHMAQDEIDRPEAVADYLDKIDSSANFLLGLINDVLDMSKIESGEMEFNPECYPLGEFLQEVKGMFQPLADDKKINLILEAAPAEAPAVMVDKVRFRQVVFNLMSNAVKFTPEGGAVTLGLACRTPQDGQMDLTLTIRDTGLGMSPAFQQRMFEPFAQEINQHTAKIKGTGLGLPIVKNIVEAMGGRIEVESREQEGTTFRISLNLCLAAEAPPPAPAAIGDPNWETISGRNILVAEDNPLNLKITHHLLLKKGAVVTCAENGRQALEAFENSPPNFFSAILMDIQMPDLDGLEAASHIRALDREDARTVPIIAMTANAFDEDVARSIQSGMNKHLTKPTKPTQLYDTLASLIK